MTFLVADTTRRIYWKHLHSGVVSAATMTLFEKYTPLLTKIHPPSDNFLDPTDFPRLSIVLKFVRNSELKIELRL